MNNEQQQILKNNLNLTLTKELVEKFNIYSKLFLEYNAHTNLMSKGDLALLFEKHIYDSLAILKYDNFDTQKSQKILDVGCGGGFPSLILAICFENLQIIGVDSVAKKIKFIQLAAGELGLKNITAIANRVETLPPQGVDIITSRAVGKMRDIWTNSKIHLKAGGEFIFYKGCPKVYNEEIIELKKNCKFKSQKIVNYELPTKEKHPRTLVIFKTVGN